MKVLLDANVVLRFLTQIPKEQGLAASRLFEKAKAAKLVLRLEPVIAAEVYYVLRSYYGLSRVDAATKLSVIAQSIGVDTDPELISALAWLTKTNVDFQDAFLAAASIHRKLQVASFDRDLDKFAGATRLVPS